IEAGQTLTLKEDLVLSSGDVLEIKGTADKRCTIVGNGHRIRTSCKWDGSVRIRHCDIRKLGAPPKLTDDKTRIAKEYPAIDLAIERKGSLVIENCVFDECAGVHVTNNGNSTTTFRGNTIKENTLARADKDINKSSSCFVAKGYSPERKLFQA